MSHPLELLEFLPVGKGPTVVGDLWALYVFNCDPQKLFYNVQSRIGNEFLYLGGGSCCFQALLLNFLAEIYIICKNSRGGLETFLPCRESAL